MKIFTGMTFFLLVLLVFGGGHGWYVQNEIIKRYHKEIIDRLREGEGM